jgi:hypothetical protein
MAEAERVMEMKRKSAEEKQKDLAKEKVAHEKTLQYHKELADQLAGLEQRKQQDFEQFLKEKAMVDEIVRKIAKEDET